MSQGTTALSDWMEDDPGIRGAGRLLHPLVRQGTSFSGREANCVFLNTHAPQFADVSTLSGIDLPDDGRAMARVDWDHDGDLDLWIANRSGPQLRLLRNGIGQRQAHLSLRLEGTTCNRDAVGARVHVVTRGTDAPPLMQTLRAGDGFLAQSSKWLCFGLGANREVEAVEVHWPGGPRERFTGIQPRGRYRIVQGSGQAQPRPTERPMIALQNAERSARSRVSSARVFAASRIPLPALPYETPRGQRRDVLSAVDAGQPRESVLLNLWASWCAPCRRELTDLARHQDQLRSAGVRVLALSVDAVDTQQQSTDTPSEPDAALAANLPTGSATAPLVEKLQLVHNQMFDIHQQLPIPSSFLIDAQGRLAAIYKGRLSISDVLQDAAHLTAGPDVARRRSVPFAGRWLAGPLRIRLLDLAWQLVEQGFLEDGMAYVANHRGNLSRGAGLPKLLVLIGNGLLARGDARQAATFYRDALAENPAYVDAQNNLAWLLATHRDAARRDGAAALRLARQAAGSARYHGPSVFDTLAAACAETGRFDEAVQHARKAIELARAGQQHDLARRIEGRLALYENRRPYRAP